MTSSDSEVLDDLKAKAASAVAIEALWDGDTQGWFVDLYAVVEGDAGYESRRLRSFSHGGDIRLFNGAVPPWPEALEAARIGQCLATLLGVPFHFPSPDHPEDDCPHWWEIAQAYPCRRCGMLLLQRPDLRWQGACHHCHIAIEREAKEALWSPEERSALRCSMCGNPAVGETGPSPWCRTCQEKYDTFVCPGCGSQVTVLRQYRKGDICSSCVLAERLSALSTAERRRIRDAAKLGMIAGIIAVKDVLGCGIGDAQEALAVLSRTSDSDDDPVG
jgi:hypothetical protein